MSQFGIFAGIAGTALTLAAAAAAIRLAWAERKGWQPPEEAVSKGTARIAALGSMVGLALIFALGKSVLGLKGLTILALVSFVVALVSLGATIYLSITRVFRRKNGKRTVGGFRLTDEAKEIQTQKRQTEAQLFKDSQDDHDRVWIPKSRAAAHIVFSFAYIALILSGTIALAAAAALAFNVSGS
jgi:disulfide bond formation protein DsbB